MSDTASVLIKAANFAAIKHKDQRRSDPEQTPYINHPIGVANILTSVSIQNFKSVAFHFVGSVRSSKCHNLYLSVCKSCLEQSIFIFFAQIFKLTSTSTLQEHYKSIAFGVIQSEPKMLRPVFEKNVIVL